MLTFCWVGKSLFMQKIIPRRKKLVTGKYYSCTLEPWPGGSHPCYFSPRPLRRARLPVVSNCWLTLWHERAPLGNLRWGWQTLSNLCSRHDVDSGCRWRIVSEFVGCRDVYIYIYIYFRNFHLAISLINATVLGVSPPVPAVSPLPLQNLASTLYPVLSSGILKDAECCRAPDELFLY